MEYINKVELAGYVGTVKVMKVGESQLARLSLATNAAYTDSAGHATVDTTWHNVTVWEGPRTHIADVKKGTFVHLTGRLRDVRYTDQNGYERHMTEVVAQTLEVVPQGA